MLVEVPISAGVWSFKFFVGCSEWIVVGFNDTEGVTKLNSRVSHFQSIEPTERHKLIKHFGSFITRVLLRISVQMRVHESMKTD